MKYVVIGASGHVHQVTDAVRSLMCPPPTAIAAGDQSEVLLKVQASTGAKIYGDYKKMLDAEQPELVVVNSRFDLNSGITTECLKRGMHVYSEKPLALTLEELQRVVNAWKSGTADLGCMLNLSCCGWFRTIVSSIQAGDIGEIRLIHGQKSYKMGTRGPWYHDRSTYGGTIPWVAIHAIDWVLRLGGDVKSITAYHSSKLNGGNGTMESAAAIILLMQNGIIGSVDADFYRPTGVPKHGDDRLRVTGTKGMLEAIDDRVYLENDKPRRELELLKTENPFVRFLNSIGTEAARQEAELVIKDTKAVLDARNAADAASEGL